MDFLEYMYYESLPYVYAALSIFAFMNHDTSKIAGVAAVVLAFCSYLVFVKRYEHRMLRSRHKNDIRL